MQRTHDLLSKGHKYDQQAFSVCFDKRRGMRVRKSIKRSEQQRFRIFSAIQISDVFNKFLQEVSLQIITVTQTLMSKWLAGSAVAPPQLSHVRQELLWRVVLVGDDVLYKEYWALPYPLTVLAPHGVARLRAGGTENNNNTRRRRLQRLWRPILTRFACSLLPTVLSMLVSATHRFQQNSGCVPGIRSKRRYSSGGLHRRPSY